VVGVENKDAVRRLDYARFEAVAVRYAFQKSGLAMPAAVVTAKGRFIYVVTFPDANRPAEEWDVEEFEIHAGKFAKAPSNEKSLSETVKEVEPPRRKISLTDFMESEAESSNTRNRRRKSSVPDFLVEIRRKHSSSPDLSLQVINRVFVPKIADVKEKVYADFRENANRSRFEKKEGLPYVDGTVAVTGDFVRERHSLGSVLTFYSPKVAQEEFIATLDQERQTSGERIVRRKDRKKDDPDDAENPSPAADYEVDSEALASRLIEHVQSQFLLDMFLKDGGIEVGVGSKDIDVALPQDRGGADGSSSVNDADSSVNQPSSSNNANEDDSLYDFSEAGLDSKDKVVFSRAWKFDTDDEYDEFHTNWVSGWYLSKLIQTGHRFDAETALVFDFGSGESKVLLCSYADGTVTSTEMLKYPQMLKYLMGSDGHSKEELKSEILRQAQEVNASLLVIGTSSWHRTASEEEKNCVNQFLENLQTESKRTNVSLCSVRVRVRVRVRVWVWVRRVGVRVKVRIAILLLPNIDSSSTLCSSPSFFHLLFCLQTQLRFIYQSSTSSDDKKARGEETLPDLSNVLDEDAKKMCKFEVGQSPLKSVTTPLDSKVEGSYEAAAVLYAASACGVPKLGVIYGAGTGSTQISAVQDGAIVGTSFYELGSNIGVSILEKSQKDRDSLQKAVEMWGGEIKKLLEDWKMASSNPDNSDTSIEGQKSTDFLKEHSKNKTVVGISAVFYSMDGTKELNQIDKTEKNGLPRITQPKMVAALEEKLKGILNFTCAEGVYKTDFKTFDKESSFLKELANVKLHLSYVEMLYHHTATFTLAREWKVNGKPFRTTWSTGWYVTHLPIPPTTVICLLY
jgi:hypothetical protein